MPAPPQTIGSTARLIALASVAAASATVNPFGREVAFYARRLADPARRDVRAAVRHFELRHFGVALECFARCNAAGRRAAARSAPC